MKRPLFLHTALRRRGRELMKRYFNLVEYFADGDHASAERFYPRLASYRRRAIRIVRKLRSLQSATR